MFAAESVVHDGVDRRASDEAGDDAAQAICQEITRAGSTIATRAGGSRRLGRPEGLGGPRRERVIGVCAGIAAGRSAEAAPPLACGGVRRGAVIAVTAACGLAGFLLLNLPQSDATADIGVALLSFALLVAVVATVRAGRGSMSDREREASAREHFERTGSWPGD